MNARKFDPELTNDRLAEIKAERDNAPRNDNGLVTTKSQGDRLASANPYLPRALHADPRLISSRWPNACARIFRIMQGAAKSSSFQKAVEGAEYPHLAKQYAETWLYYMTRTQAAPLFKVDHNPFRNLSDTDAMNKFVRFVEDICDKSTGKLGPWASR